jgi:hypothetical protein
MRQTDLEIRAGIHDAAKHQRGKRQGTLGQIANGIGQMVAPNA